MLCSIYKWKISRAMDSGKPLSGQVKRHLRRCSACREFSRLNEELERQLTEDAAALLKCADASLGERVLSSLGARADSLSRPKRSLLKPVLAAAASLTVVSVGIIWLVTSRSDKMPPLDSLFAFDAPSAYLEKAALKAESPYDEEILELKQAFKSTADVLRASLDIGLGEKTE